MVVSLQLQRSTSNRRHNGVQKFDCDRNWIENQDDYTCGIAVLVVSWKYFEEKENFGVC